MGLLWGEPHVPDRRLTAIGGRTDTGSIERWRGAGTRGIRTGEGALIDARTAGMDRVPGAGGRLRPSISRLSQDG